MHYDGLLQIVDLVEKIVNASDDSYYGGVDAGLRRDVQHVVSICSQPLPQDLPWWQKLFWAGLFTFMLTIATGGNLIVMWIVLGKPHEISPFPQHPAL